MPTSLLAVVVDCREPRAQADLGEGPGFHGHSTQPVLRDPEGNEFCASRSTTITGWASCPSSLPAALRHRAALDDGIELSRAAYHKMWQNLAWATGYNVITVPIAAGVLAFAGVTVSPAVAAILMSASTVVVAANAQLLRRLDLNPEHLAGG
jgi:hypothetical protein